MTNFLNDLNSSQREAVTYIDGPSLVIAGAGSGKTRVLTCKIAYLLQQGWHPSSILALTFTNKAAREERDAYCHPGRTLNWPPVCGWALSIPYSTAFCEPRPRL